jgi:hypothetical protein
LPGIWDDVASSFTGPFRLQRVLLLPSLADQKITAKLLIKSAYPAQIDYADPKQDICSVQVQIREKKSGKSVGSPVTTSAKIVRDRLTEVQLDVPVSNPRYWIPPGSGRQVT